MKKFTDEYNEKLTNYVCGDVCKLHDCEYFGHTEDCWLLMNRYEYSDDMENDEL